MYSLKNIDIVNPPVQILVVIIFAIVFSLPDFVNAQISQPRRYELPRKGSDELFHIIPLKEEGLALIRDLNKYNGSNKLWEIVLLDTALQEKKTFQIEIKDRNRMVGYEVAPGSLFFLFRTGETSKNDFELIEIDVKGGEEKGHHQFKPDLDFKLTYFNQVGDNFTFGGYVNNEPAVLLYEVKENHIKVIPGFFQKDTELLELRTNQNRTFNAIILDRGSKQNRKLTFRTFDESGKQLLEDIVPIDDQKTLQAGITSTLEREDLAVAGTWGERNSKQAIGFYFMSVDPFNEQKITFTDFGQLSHFLDFLNPKRADRIKANSKDDQAAGRIPNFTSYAMPFKLAEYKDGFLLLAEVYTPTSNMSPYYSNPYYYNPYYAGYGNPYGFPFYYPGMNRMYRPYGYNNSNMRTTDEIKTNATVLLSFDPKGKVNWDKSFKLDEVKLSGVEQAGDFYLNGDKLTFIYKKESELRYKEINVADDTSTEAMEKVRTNSAEDVIRSEKEIEGGVRQWYGNSFYVWGYQTIKNSTKEDRVRDVFYINKIMVR